MGLEDVKFAPAYCATLNLASHYMYVALEEMRRTPCVTKEQFEKIVGMYSDLNDYIESVKEAFE